VLQHVARVLLHPVGGVVHPRSAREVLQVVLVLVEQRTQGVFSDHVRHAHAGVLAGGQAGGVGAGDRGGGGVGAAEAGGGVLLGLQPQGGDAGAHAAAHAGLGGGAVHVRVGGGGVRAGGAHRPHVAAVAQRGAHGPRQHRGVVHAHRHPAGPRVEAVHRVLVVVAGHHGPQWVHRPREGLRAQRRGHLGPVVVRVRAVQRVVRERLHELRPESRLEVRRRHRRVHRVALPLAPLGSPVLEPHLGREKGGTH